MLQARDWTITVYLKRLRWLPVSCEYDYELLAQSYSTLQQPNSFFQLKQASSFFHSKQTSRLFHMQQSSSFIFRGFMTVSNSKPSLANTLLKPQIFWLGAVQHCPPLSTTVIEPLSETLVSETLY